MTHEELVYLAEFGSGSDLAEGIKSTCGFDLNTIIQDDYLKGMTLLGCAARMGNLDTLDYLICQGADLNLCDRKLGGEPPFNAAVMRGDLECIKRLLAAGVNLNCQGWMGLTGIDRLRYFLQCHPNSGLDRWIE
jgi:hypothetical protein